MATSIGLLSPAPSSEQLALARKDASNGGFQLALAQASSTPDTAKVAKAAKQFEALIMGQVLKASRDSGGGWLGDDANQTSEMAVEMAEQQFAEALTVRGGLGLAKLVTADAARHQAKVASSGSPVSNLPAPSSTDSGH